MPTRWAGDTGAAAHGRLLPKAVPNAAIPVNGCFRDRPRTLVDPKRKSATVRSWAPQAAVVLIVATRPRADPPVIAPLHLRQVRGAHPEHSARPTLHSGLSAPTTRGAFQFSYSSSARLSFSGQIHENKS